jgi:hypothetical protein
MNSKIKLRHLALTLAITAALGLSPSAEAQTEREAQLEARVAELERLVSQLVGQQQELATKTEAVAAQVATAPPLPAGVAPIQRSTITPAANPGTAFTYGGFVRADFMATSTDGGEIADSSAGRLFYLPSATPVGAADEGMDFDAHAQFSRIWFGADTTLDSGDKLRGYVELDFFGGALGNEVATNTYGVTLRHVWATWNKWGAGQFWSNFQDTAALPDAVDFVGPTEGTIFVRQAQVRYTSGPWSFSLENPETTITPFNGGTRIVSDDNSLPDFTARYLHKGDWGHFTVAALARQLKHETITGIDDSASGFALSVSGKWILNPTNDIRYMLSGGDGLGRYLGFGIGADAALDAGGDLEAQSGLGGFVAWRHVFNPKLRSSVFYSFAEFDNDVALTGTGVTSSSDSIQANLIYTPLPKLDVGLGAIFGNRELESGADGDLTRLHAMVRYSF